MSALMQDPLAAASVEIVRMHDFFGAWFRGDLAAAAFEPDCLSRLAPGFENVQPSGRVLTLADLMEPIRAARGTNPAFRIEIREPRLLGAYPEAGLIHASYVEAQFGARNTHPPDNLRRSTVLFAAEGDRLIWRHIHETAMPA
ncbi:MAG: hypothetical protein AAF074_08470 [Pseudomonadota bacterium]